MRSVSVAGHHVFVVEVIAQHRNDTQFLDGVEVGNDLVGAFESVLGFHAAGARGCD